MCSPVIYIYSCNHTQDMVYRCQRTPVGSTQAQFDRCIEREIRINGRPMDHYVNEICPGCDQMIRAQRREARRRSRAAASAMALAAVPPRRSLTNTPVAQQARLDRENAADTPPSGNSSSTQSSAADSRQREADAAARQERIRRLRPLETNFLQNIGRAEMDTPQRTPSQIWRFFQ